MIIKLRSERRGDHVHETIFAGPEENETFHNCGTLVFGVGEWQLFGAALMLGARQTQGNLRVVFEGDEQVVTPTEEVSVGEPLEQSPGLQGE